jgi:hypothetical protein
MPCLVHFFWMRTFQVLTTVLLRAVCVGEHMRPHRFPGEASMVQLWVRHSKIGMRNAVRKKKENDVKEME